MNKPLALLVSVVVGLTVLPARSQPRPPPGPSFDGAMDKLFGDNAAFSATMEMHTTDASAGDVTMSAKIAHVDAKARIEMDILGAQGNHIPPQAAAQMKQMGMSKMTFITRSDKGLNYMVYPDMKGYTEIASPAKRAAASEYKTEVTKLGQETVDSHDCIKNKVVVTGPDGQAHESTVWNASDLKQFPVKIQTTAANGNVMEIVFKEVKMDKPDDALFDPPSDCKKYDNMMSLMMSRMKGAPAP